MAEVSSRGQCNHGVTVLDGRYMGTLKNSRTTAGPRREKGHKPDAQVLHALTSLDNKTAALCWHRSGGSLLGVQRQSESWSFRGSQTAYHIIPLFLGPPSTLVCLFLSLGRILSCKLDASWLFPCQLRLQLSSLC